MFPPNHPMFNMFPFAHMFVPGDHQIQQQQQGGTRVPARIRFALEFLNHITSKTMSRVAVTEHQIHEISGQTLSKSEINAQSTACHVINDYLLGKLTLDKWETDDIERSEVKQGTLLTCMGCYPHARPDCRICQGSGKVVVVPINSNTVVVQRDEDCDEDGSDD